MTFNWAYDNHDEHSKQNGISYQVSEVQIAHIRDGTSNTAMVGEKYMDPLRYADGHAWDDDQNIFLGHDRDVNRYTWFPPQPDREGYNPSDWYHFGSAHPVTFQMAYCDGSVHTLLFDIDEDVFRLLGGRDDDFTNLRFPDD